MYDVLTQAEFLRQKCLYGDIFRRKQWKIFRKFLRPLFFTRYECEL